MMNNTTMINGWNLSLFSYHAGYLSYSPVGALQIKFVARFPYAAQKRRKNSFVKFLVNNFTPDEYFTATIEKAPYSVLVSKGWRIA